MGEKSSTTSASEHDPEAGRPRSDFDETLREAQDATNEEHKLTLVNALRTYPKAIGWSVFLSTAVVMEGYDLVLMGNLYGK
jgi:MFS transporter, SP family, general alpha glucoside:H+ symporter